MNPTFKQENQLRKKGYKLIAGVDEVGRGALAGPIVAVAVILPKDFRVGGIKDSKLLTPRQREELYFIICDRAVATCVAFISHKMIDKRGIAWANKMVIKRALCKMKPLPDFALVDAMLIDGLAMPTKSIIRGDRLVKSIAAASIVAKVTRDKYLVKQDKKYPQYGFARHKGYGTKFHRDMLCEHGPCEVHRKSFGPVRALLGNEKNQESRFK